MPKQKQKLTLTPNLPKGLVRTEDGYAIEIADLPPSQFFFHVDDFKISRREGNLNITFGSISCNNPDVQEYNLAVEISFPVQEAFRFIYEIIWNKNAPNQEKTFAEIVDTLIEKYRSIYGEPQQEQFNEVSVPLDNSSFRKFTANYASFTIAGDEGMVEFFYIPSEVRANLNNGRAIRSQISNMLCAVMPLGTYHRFLNETKAILEPFAEHFLETENEEELEV